MRARWSIGIMAGALMIFTCGAARSQDQQQQSQQQSGDDKAWDKSNMHFNQHERSAMKGWWAGNKDKPPAKLHPEDNLTPEQAAQLVRGFVLDKDWQDKVHIIPPSLGFQLRRPPIGWVVYELGGHYIILVHHHDWKVEDVVDLNNTQGQ